MPQHPRQPGGAHSSTGVTSRERPFPAQVSGPRRVLRTQVWGRKSSSHPRGRAASRGVGRRDHLGVDRMLRPRRLCRSIRRVTPRPLHRLRCSGIGSSAQDNCAAVARIVHSSGFPSRWTRQCSSSMRCRTCPTLVLLPCRTVTQVPAFGSNSCGPGCQLANGRNQRILPVAECPDQGSVTEPAADGDRVVLWLGRRRR